MKRLGKSYGYITMAAIAAIIGGVIAIGSATAAKQDKVAICCKGKTIYVNASAVHHHIAHGDTVGRCP